MPRPNILILMSDEHSIRCLGYRRDHAHVEPVRTPTLDGLAASGTVYDNAYTPMPLCTPARMCFLTARDAHRCGAWSNGSILDPRYATLPGHFAAHGYETCLVGKMHFGGSLQFHGFRHRPFGDFGGAPSHQPDPLQKAGAGLTGLRTRTVDAGVTAIPEALLQEQLVARETVAFLREHAHRQPDTPWLLCASFSRPHFPLTAPQRMLDRYWPEGVTHPWVGRTGDAAEHPVTLGVRRGFQTDAIGEQEALRARAAYFACVDYLDEVLGDLLGTLERTGQLENTIIAYVSDHGEMAGEHGLWWKHTWHEAATRIPFIVQVPEQRRGALAAQRRLEPASLNDLFPTLCGLAGLPQPEEVDGLDLSAATRGASPAVPAARLVSQSPTPRWGEGSEFRVVRAGRFKYVAFRGAPELLFDVESDPREQKDLAPRATGESARALAEGRRVASEGFSWDALDAERERAQGALTARYRKRSGARGPNQFLLADGRLVEAETTLYQPVVASANPAADFDDWPRGGGGAQ